MSFARCAHVRSTYLLPGWGCCRCRVYNGYQRDACRSCGHPHCYDEGGDLGEEARRFREAGTDVAEITRLMGGGGAAS